MSRARELAKLGGAGQQVIAGVSSFVGVSTFASDVFMLEDLSVLGDLNVTGDLSYDETTATNSRITGVSTTKDLVVTQNAIVTGILTASKGVTGNINATGVSTITQLRATTVNATGVSTITQLRATTVNATGVVTALSFSGPITGNVTGNVTGNLTGLASSATQLATGRTVAITGDLAYTSGSFNGAANVTGIGTLATVNSNVGSFGSQTLIPVVTVNEKGLVTAVTTAAVGTALTVSGDSGSENIDLLTETLTISGGTNLTSSAASNTVTVNLDPNISLTSVVASGVITATSGFSGNVTGNVTGNVNASGIVTAAQFVTGASGAAIGINTNTISGPATITLDPAAVGDNTGLVVIKGDLQIDGTTTTVNSTTVTVDDKNLVLASGAANDAAADGGGITLESGDGNKTFNWVNSTDAWTSSEDLNLLSGKVYEINGVTVLSSNTLGSGVVNSSLTSVGTLGSLTVTGAIVANGGVQGNINSSGVSTFSNGPVLIGSATSTGTASQRLQVTGGAYVSGNLGIGTTNPTSKLHVIGDVRVSGVVTATTFVGALTGTATSTTNIPNLTGAITSNNTTTSLGSFTSANLAAALTDETGTGANVFATSPTLVTPVLGAATATSIVVSSGSTFTNGPILVGTATSTGTASQRLQVTGGAYVSGNLGIGTTNPTSKLHVVGDARITGVITATTFIGALTGNVTGNVVGNINSSGVSTITTLSGTTLTYTNVNSTNTVLSGITTVSNTVVPNANNTVSLGTSATRWANVFSNDLDLSNEGSANSIDGTWGSFLVQEGEEHLYIINRRSGKKFRFVLEEV